MLGARQAGAVAAARVTDEIRREIAWLEARPDFFLLTLGAPAYPPHLAAIPDPPPVLVGRGDPGALRVPAVAVVGSRQATPAGCEMSRQLGHDLAGAGVCVVSGLALGVDIAAHEGALAAQGRSVGVMGNGADRVYPTQHRPQARAMLARGAVISELPLGTQPRPAHFPRRNRIIAGLTLATVVVEAAERSGALITARLAGEFGRDVLAVPGAVGNPLARGCHALLKDGAGLVEDYRDVLVALGIAIDAPPEPGRGAPARTDPGADDVDPEVGALLSACEGAPASFDQIVERCGLTAPRVSSMLLLLELDGAVAALPGGLYQRRSPKRS